MINQSLHQNPSIMAPETLEQLLVQRRPLLNELYERHKASLTSKTKHYSLLIGARGMGKSHLTSLLYHRLKADEDITDKALIVWMREEEWGVSSYLDLLIEILKVINRDYHFPTLSQQIDELFNQSVKVAEFDAENILKEILDEKTALILIENLDMVFDGLNTAGQNKLRALLQNTRQITIMATAPKAFAAVMKKNLPFYGFFNTINLNKLSLEEVLQLLKKIAALDEKPDLVRALDTDIGVMRVKALHHLANGNPRIYVIFSQFITAESLNEFTSAMIKLLNDLTPYYQAKMGTLSPQQRKLVMFLVRECGATSVKEIARKCHITNQTTSSQLKKLKDQGYVDQISMGRESYYELAEPLMRLVLGMKEAIGTPAQIIIELLRHWFSLDELREMLNNHSQNTIGKIRLAPEWIEKALEHPKNIHLERGLNDFFALVKDGNTLAANGEFEEILNAQKPNAKDIYKYSVKAFKSMFLNSRRFPYSEFNAFYCNLRNMLPSHPFELALIQMVLFLTLSAKNQIKSNENHLKLGKTILTDAIENDEQISANSISVYLEIENNRTFTLPILKNKAFKHKWLIASRFYSHYLSDELDMSTGDFLEIQHAVYPEFFNFIDFHRVDITGKELE